MEGVLRQVVSVGGEEEEKRKLNSAFTTLKFISETELNKQKTS